MCATTRITFPGVRRVVVDADVPCLQWRDRAGFAPASLLGPLWAPEAFVVYLNPQRLTQAWPRSPSAGDTLARRRDCQDAAASAHMDIVAAAAAMIRASFADVW